MKLTLPEGYQPPDTAKPGEPFEAVATLQASEDGGFMLVALDGVKLMEEEEPEVEVEVEVENPDIQIPFEEGMV